MTENFPNTYVRNVMEYFQNKKVINTSSVFEKAAYDLYKMVLDKKSEGSVSVSKETTRESEILAQIEYMNKLPISYMEMRCFFG